MGDGVGDDFFIERPQVFDAAAAAAQDDELAVAVAGGLQCCGNLEGGGGKMGVKNPERVRVVKGKLR